MPDAPDPGRAGGSGPAGDPGGPGDAGSGPGDAELGPAVAAAVREALSTGKMSTGVMSTGVMSTGAAGDGAGVPADPAGAGAAGGILSVRRLSGGASRHTWMVEAGAGGPVVVQRERAGSVGANLPMAAQAELLRAAAQRGVPVPEVLASGADDGAGFVVLAAVDGETVPRRILRSEALAAARSGLAREAGLALARIHSLEPDVLDDTAPADPLEQLRTLADALGEPHPAFEIGLARLAEQRPPERTPVLVHGDYRMGNLIVDEDGLAAVLDWELAHVGSPVEDLGWFCGRAWRFGSPMRAGGVGSAEDLLAGYAEGGGVLPGTDELRWWEAWGTLRWGLICVLQASVHLRGHHRSVELAAIGRRAAECEEDLLELVDGPSGYEPPAAGDGSGPRGPHDRPSAAELLDAVGEHLEAERGSAEGSSAFGLRVAGNVVALVARELRLAPELDRRRSARLARLGVEDEAALAAAIRTGGATAPEVTEVVRELVRDKLAVSHPGYWRGDT